MHSGPQIVLRLYGARKVIMKDVIRVKEYGLKQCQICFVG